MKLRNFSKTEKNNKGEKNIMKKIIVAILTVTMFMATGMSVFAYTTYNNYGQAGTGYVPDYSGTGSYNGSTYYQYNNGTGYYGYWNNNQYYDYYGQPVYSNGYSADGWFNNQYGNMFKFTWIKSPQAPAIRGDYFRAVYDTEMSYSQNSNYTYNNNYNYGYNYGYNTGYNYGYNNYGMGNPQMFADYWQYSKYQRMISILNGTGGGYQNSNILDGREVNGQLWLDFDSCILRGEAAKLCIRANQAWWQLPQIRGTMIFQDTMGHWAMDEISQAYACGLVNGVGGNFYNPEATLTNQEMLVVFCNLVDRSSKYTIENFIDMVNAGDVARITEVYWGNIDDGYGNNGNSNSWRFTTSTVPLNVGDYFDLKGIISNWNNTIKYSSSNSQVATVDSSGNVRAVGVGNATITATDSYGNMDTVNIVVSAPGSDKPVTDPTNFRFTQSSITVQKGERIDLSSYLEGATGNVTYASNDTNIVSLSGAYALAVNVGYANVTAMCANQTAVISIQVVDNSAAQPLNISVQYADFNESGTLNLIVRGVPTGYHVEITSLYSLVNVNEQNIGMDTMKKFQITGLQPTTGYDAEGQPEGGLDSVIVKVFDGNGIQVWEDPQGHYCPQLNRYHN